MAQTALEAPDKPATDWSKLSRAETALILTAYADGKSQRTIAQLIGCHHSTVARVLNDFSDTTVTAKARTRNRALDIAEATIKGSIKAANDGKPEAGLELLDRLGVAEKRQKAETGPSIQIIQGISIGGVGAGPEAKVINVPRGTLEP